MLHEKRPKKIADKHKKGYNIAITSNIPGKENWSMNTALTPDFTKIPEQQQAEVRQLVIHGLQQAKEGNTRDFYTVCDRLEKKYTNASL